MVEKTNEPSIHKEEWANAKNELVQLIDEFLRTSRKTGDEPDVDY